MVVVVPSLAGVIVLILIVSLLVYCRKRSSKKKSVSINASYVAATDFLTFKHIGEENEETNRAKVSVQELLQMRSYQLAAAGYDGRRVPDFPIDKIKYVQNLGEGAFGQVRQTSIQRTV